MPKYLHKSKGQSVRPPKSAYGFKRLEFFSAFIDANQFSQEQISKALKIAPSSVCRWFIIDDVKISRIFEVAELLGYNFLPCIYPKGQNVINDKYVNFTRQLYCNDDGNIKMNRTFFLKFNLDRANITLKEIASKIGVEYASINRWFIIDDIAVSRIIQICEALDWDIEFRFEKKSSLSAERQSFPTLRYSFSVEKEVPLKGV